MDGENQVRRKRNRLLGKVYPLGALVWFMLVITVYYVQHKPFTPGTVQGVFNALVEVVVAGGVVSLSGGLGMVLIATLELPAMVVPGLAAALGLGALSLLALAYGTVLPLTGLLPWLFAFVVGVVLRRQAYAWWRAWLPFGVWLRQRTRLEATSLLVSALIFGIAALIALAPPLKFDALVYHLALPQHYLAQGSFGYIDENMFWGMPQLGEVLFTLVSFFAGGESAALLAWASGLLALALLLGTLSEYLHPLSAIVGVTSMVAGYTLAASLSWGYVDWIVVLLSVGFLVVLAQWQKGRNKRLLWLAGVFAGLALGTKYSAGVLLPAGLAVFLWDAVKAKDGWVEVIRNAVGLIVPAVIVSLPWWLKNLLAVGNPFYPFFYPSGAMDAFRLSFYNIPVWGNGWEVLRLPWQASIAGVEGTPGYSASIGPLFLALGLLPLVGSRWLPSSARRLSVFTALIAGSGIIVWGIASRFSGYLIQSRLYFAIFPALAGLAGSGYESLRQAEWLSIRWGKVMAALVLLVLMLNGVELAIDAVSLNPLGVILGLKSEETYLGENLGWYQPAMQAVRELPEGSRVLTLWEPRSYYCFPVCSADEVLDRWARDHHKYEEPGAILDAWKQEGITHILMNEMGRSFVQENDRRYAPGDWIDLDEVISRLEFLHDFGGAYQLYRVPDA